MWSKEWPTETGWYWLYYSRQSYNADKNCWETVYTLDSAQVRSAGSGPNKFLIYIRGGAFLFKCEEGTKGRRWMNPSCLTHKSNKQFLF